MVLCFAFCSRCLCCAKGVVWCGGAFRSRFLVPISCSCLWGAGGAKGRGLEGDLYVAPRPAMGPVSAHGFSNVGRSHTGAFYIFPRSNRRAYYLHLHI